MISEQEGTRRLRVVLGGMSLLSCALAMIAVLILYGTPYRMLWWWIMTAVLVAAYFAPRLLVPAFEWVIEGYRRDPRRDPA